MSWPAAEGRHCPSAPSRWWYGCTGKRGRPDRTRTGDNDEPVRHGGTGRPGPRITAAPPALIAITASAAGYGGGERHSGRLVRERLQALRQPQGGRRAEPGPAARRDHGAARPERRGQIHLAGHAARVAQAHQREDQDVRLRPVPRGEVRPGGRHAPVRRADARGHGARARDAGDQAAPQARTGRHHAQAGRHRQVRRPAGGPAVRRPDPAGPASRWPSAASPS